MNSWAIKTMSGRSEEVIQVQRSCKPALRAHRIFGDPSGSTSVATIEKRAENMDFNCNVSIDSNQFQDDNKMTTNSDTFGWFLGKRDTDELYQADDTSDPSILLSVGLKILSEVSYKTYTIVKDGESYPDAEDGQESSIEDRSAIGIPVGVNKPLAIQLLEHDREERKINQKNKRVEENSPKNPFKPLNQNLNYDNQDPEHSNRQTYREDYKTGSIFAKFSAFRTAGTDKYGRSTNADMSLLNSTQQVKKVAVAIDVSFQNIGGTNGNQNQIRNEKISSGESPNDIYKPFKPVFLQHQTADQRDFKPHRSETSQLQSIDSELMFIKKLKLKSANDHKTEDNCTAVLSLMALLDKQTISVSQVTCLTNYEFLLFKSLAKKLYGIAKFEDTAPEDFVNMVNLNISSGKQKRLEEELKIIFKKTLKHLMNVQKEKMDIEAREPLKKLNYTIGFYKHYFEKTHIENVTFREYFKITTRDGLIDFGKLNAVLIHPLTVNATHLAMVTLSQPFKEDLIRYLDTQIIEEYRKVRLLKTKRILINFYDLAAKNPSKAAIEDFTSNHQMKLPWSTRDLEHAISTFKKALVKPTKGNPLCHKHVNIFYYQNKLGFQILLYF